MLAKLENYKGVIIFYLLLALTLVGMAVRTSQINSHTSNLIVENNLVLN